MIQPQTHKRCPHCSRCLPFLAFNRNRRLHNGVASWCRACTTEATRDWRKRNPELMAWMNEQRRLGERECVDCGETFTSRTLLPFAAPVAGVSASASSERRLPDGPRNSRRRAVVCRGLELLTAP